MDHIWHTQSVVNIREFINNIKEYEHSSFIEKWKQDIKGSAAHTILRTYKSCKKEFLFEPYLLEMHNTDLRKAIVRFRLSSHSLRIETEIPYTKPWRLETNLHLLRQGWGGWWNPPNNFMNISLTSWWARWRLKSPAIRLFTQPFIRRQSKKTSKLRVTGFLWWEFIGDRWIPRTNG